MTSCLLLTLLASAAEAARFEHVPTVGLGDELTCIGISHRDPNFVMVGTSNGKIHRSTDGGITWQLIVVSPARSLYFGRERQADPRYEYALGLPGKSPHLQSWLRSKGLNTSGVNWQQLLVQKGDKSVSINWIEVDWHDENRVFVGTPDGLYRSTNKGRTFLRIWQGRASMAERVINAVVTDPGDPKKLLVGTAAGLFVSNDKGITFKKEMNFYIYGGYIRSFFFDREFKGLVHMAMGGAAMASPNSGKDWITTHWSLWGPRSAVQWISLGPKNIRALATKDGIYASFQGGEMGTWKRRGYRFVAHNVISVAITKTANEWYAATPDAIWFTQDYGNNWRKIMQLGGKELPRWMVAWANDPKHLWMITNRHVYRYGGVPGLERTGRRRGELRKLLDVPKLSAFWKKVLKHKHLYFTDIQDYRDKAPWASFLPDLYVGGTAAFGADRMQLRAFPYLHMPFTYWNALGDKGVNIYAIAVWDLTRLIFDRRQLPHFGRIDRNLQHLRRDLTTRVHRLYAEYVALARRMVRGVPQSAVASELERIRLQEISAFFDEISGGYWTKKTGGLR